MRPYDLYMMDYMNEYRQDEVQYIRNPLVIEEAKDDVYKINYFMRDHLQIPFIHNPLSKPRIQEAIAEIIGRFIDDHTEQLSTSGPVHIFTFGEKEVQPIYDIFGISANQLIELYHQLVQETYYGKISKIFTGFITNAPHKLMITAMLIDAIQNEYEDMRKCCEYMFAFTDYPIIYRMFWKTGVREDVMSYTIEHLSSKNIITQVKNLQELLEYDAHKAVMAHIDDLKKGVDNVYIDLMYRIRNQIKSKMNNISNAYYRNVEENSTQHKNTTQFDDGEFADMEGHATNVAQIVEKITGKFATSEINDAMAKLAANGSKVDKENLKAYLAQIYAVKDNKVSKLIENIITSYFQKYPTNTSLSSGEFLNYGLSLYRSIGTSKDPLLIEIKTILSRWVYDIANVPSQYARTATIIAYTRALYNYHIFMINYYK